jgi:hypothetical protein
MHTEVYIQKINKSVNFLCLAGDFEIKAVDILIDSWLAVDCLNGSMLTIACPNIPSHILQRISKVKSITIVTKAPLSKYEKDKLLSGADVSVFLTHIDGGANLTEGMEYGHASITNTSHRSLYTVQSKNGIVVNFPDEYYKCGQYGVAYDSVEEYLTLVEHHKKTGLYDSSKLELSQAISEYIHKPELLQRHKTNTLIAVSTQNISCSNATLLNIYRTAIAT